MGRRVQNQRIVHIQPKARRSDDLSTAQACEAHYWPADEFLARVRRAAAHRHHLKLAPIVLCAVCRARFTGA